VKYFEHITSLIERLERKPAEKAALMKKFAAKDPAKRNEVIGVLAAEFPVASNILEIWTDARARAVHFFHVPPLYRATHANMKQLVTQKYGKDAASGEWHPCPKPEQKFTSHVSAVRLTEGELELRVHLYFHKKARVDGGQQGYTTDLDVDVQIDLERKGAGRIAAVYGSTTPARLGLRLALEEVLGQSIPVDRPALDEFMAPLKVSEAMAKKLAHQLGMKVTEMGGIDPKDRLGGYGVWGKSEGSKRLPLDLDDPRVKEREKAGNGIRDYCYDFAHGDGFEEWVEARFMFTGQHPHVTFTTVSSRPAKRYLLDAIRDTLVV
jgi:hypothetical protein